MRAKPISRLQARKALEEIPMHEVLLVSNSELTAKQMEFAKQVALGNTGAESYRKAYSDKGKKKTQGDNASRLKADSRVQAAISAFEAANLAATYRSASGLRELVIDSLVQVLIDPETKPAQKIQAAKTIGTINEVSLFTEHKTITHIQDSADIKEKILAQIKTLMLGTGAGNEVQDVDAIELLNELTTSEPDSIDSDQERVSGDDSERGDPHPTPTPSELNEPPPDHVHTIPLQPSQSETTPMHFEIKE
jgi:hypothetical protein